MTLDVRGSGRSWAVYHGDDRITGFLGNYNLAAMVATSRERKLRLSTRACLCCGADFQSEGAHNRLCNPCRRNPLRLA